MNIDEFVAARKRETQYGNPSSTADQAAKDILASINDGISRITTNWLWDFLFEPLTITLVAGTEDYTLPVNISKIIDIYAGDNRSLVNITIKEYHKYKKGDSSNAGSPSWYMYTGRDAAGAKKLRIGDIATGALTGFGKLKTTRFVAADLGTAKSMLPFPAEGENVLTAFVLADIYRLQGKEALIFPQEASAKQMLKDWRGEEATNPSNTATSGLPEYLRNKRANRRGGYVV